MTVNQGPQDGSQTPGNGDHSAQPGGIPPQPGGVPAYANAFPAQGGGVPPCNGGYSGGVPPYPPQQGGFPPQPPQKRPVYKRVWFWIVIAAVVLALIGAFMNGPGSGSSSSGTVTAGSGSQPREQGRNDIQPLTVVDSNYSLSSGYVKYVLEIQTTNTDYKALFAHVNIVGKTTDGSIRFSDDWTIGDIEPGTTTFWASQAGNGDSLETDTVEITVSVDDSDWIKSDGVPENLYTITNTTVNTNPYGMITATGEITLNEEGDTYRMPMIVVVLKDADGKLVGGFDGFIDSDLTVGTQSTFEVNNFAMHADYASYEVYANPWM